MSRFATFLTVVLGIWTALHVYVFWRMACTPLIANHVSRRVLALVALGLWLSYPVARFLEARKHDFIAHPLEYVGACWIGMLFLLFVGLLVVDILTLGGTLFPRYAPQIRGWVLISAAGLSLLGLVQGLRPPVVRDYEVRLPGLPPERNGTVLIALSDIHLGTLIGDRWLEHLVNRLQDMRPDLLVIVGDMVDGNVDRVTPYIPQLKKLQAPLGVWAVTGNHEYYAGLQRCLAVFADAGIKVLRDQHAEVAPGLILAGVDDLAVRGQFEEGSGLVLEALAKRPAGATIFLSHSPLQAVTAEKAGTGLMLSGHTHNGQIWPFEYLVRTRFDYIGGKYDIGKMPLIVCRGTGTWGPRMRLWRPSEILRIKLLSAP